VSELVLILDREAVGHRIYLVRKFGAGLSGRALGQGMGSTDPGLVSKLESGRLVTHERMKLVADACAGKGLLKKTSPEEILSFLEGRIDELPVVLDGSFSQMSYFDHEPFGGRVVVLPRRNTQVDVDRELLPRDVAA
jgi:hypothetical protein